MRGHPTSTWNINYVLERGKNNESLSIYFLYFEILVIFYCDSSEFSQIHTREAGTLQNKQDTLAGFSHDAIAVS